MNIRCADICFAVFTIILGTGYALYLWYEYPREHSIILQAGQRITLNYVNLRHEPPPIFYLKRPIRNIQFAPDKNEQLLIKYRFIQQHHVSPIKQIRYYQNFRCIDCSAENIGLQSIILEIMSVDSDLNGKQVTIIPASRIRQTSVFRTPLRWKWIRENSSHIYGALSILEPYPLWSGL
ncbi:hypothetical protein [Wielerella bovis]|uniref:hypothetical protein n=1 Tax=Wielerella bovis TaxID=2917790 RepID=UPI00201862FD|nr:hypothetical protein [Wielerella bovis]MCG7656743.1 hypothetical protein [Wielerella bovis]MCG7658966.1 hypothetical protein [Wielerella bovis]